MKRWAAIAAGLVLVLGLSACGAKRGSIRKLSAPKHPTLASATAAAALSPSAKAFVGGNPWWAARREFKLDHNIQPSLLAQEERFYGPYGPEEEPSVSAPAVVKAVTPAVPKNEAKRYGWIKPNNRAFTTGEKLTFAVQYGSITAGYATLSIPEVVVESGRPVYHIVAEAKTHPFFEKIFKVQDRIESFIDVDYLFPWRYEKHLREGSYSADARYVYDQRAAFMREPSKGKDEPMPIGSHDVISCFYFFRTMDMTVGSESSIRVSADDMKNYELKVNVLRKEHVQSLAGEFDCVVVQPHLAFQGVFQQKGEVFIWLTDDERRIPVKVRSKIAIGSININLQDAEWVESAP
jgi:hypothetical protein